MVFVFIRYTKMYLINYKMSKEAKCALFCVYTKIVKIANINFHSDYYVHSLITLGKLEKIMLDVNKKT